MEREIKLNQELRKSYESKLIPDQSIKFLNQPTFIQAGLWYYLKYSNVRAQCFYQIYFAAELLKTLGNNYYKQQKIELALEAYQESVSIFRYVKPNKDAMKKNFLTDSDLEYICYSSSNENENRKVKQIQHVLYLNLSIGYIKTQQFANAIAACTLDLEIEPNSVKSLYRRALARFSLKSKQRKEIDLKLAIADLKKALEIDPNDEDIKELLCQIEENQNFKKQIPEFDNKQQSDVEKQSFVNAQNMNDNLSVSSNASSRTANSTQKSQYSSNILKETSSSLIPVLPTKQVETDLISAKSTPQTLEKVNNQPLTSNDSSKESENKENNHNQQQQFTNHLEYLMKTQPSFKEYYNRQLQFAQKQVSDTKTPNKIGNMEQSKASAASILQNIKSNNQQQQSQKQQKPKQQIEQESDETIEEKDNSPQPKQQQQQKQLSSHVQKLRAKEKKKASEQARILKEIEDEIEQQKKREQEAELQRQQQLLKAQQLKEEQEKQERLRKEQLEQELARQALKSKIVEAKTSIKKGGRKMKNNVAPSSVKQQPQQQNQKEQVQQQLNQQQQQQLQQMLARQINESQKSSQNNPAQNGQRKPNLKPKQAFEEDNFFEKREEERLKQYKSLRDEDDEDVLYQNEANDPLENIPPYIPPDPTNGGEVLDLCEGNQILRQREKDKIFQHSYKANYQDYLDQKHFLDSDVDIPEIPGLIPPSYKSYAQKRRETLLNENTTQEKKELKKFQKILIWVSLIIFIFTLWWAMGDDAPVLPTVPTEQIENDDLNEHLLFTND